MSLAGREGRIATAPWPPEQAFDPEATHAMGIAFEGARWVLGLAGRSGDVTERLARTIIEFATRGERNPWRLRARVFRTLRR